MSSLPKLESVLTKNKRLKTIITIDAKAITILFLLKRILLKENRRNIIAEIAPIKNDLFKRNNEAKKTNDSNIKSIGSTFFLM